MDRSPICKQLFPSHLAPAAVTQTLHDRVNLLLEHLGQLRAVLVHSRCFAVVEPGVVEHQPDVVNILPGFLVLPGVQLPLDGGKVNWVLYNVKVVLKKQDQIHGDYLILLDLFEEITSAQ